MGSLDNARLKKFISQLYKGDWDNLLPEKLYISVKKWFAAHENDESVVVRFTFFEDKDSDNMEKYALHLECAPIIKKKVKIKNMYVPGYEKDEVPLALPPTLYDFPLFCMPSANELLDNIP